MPQWQTLFRLPDRKLPPIIVTAILLLAGCAQRDACLPVNAPATAPATAPVTAPATQPALAASNQNLFDGKTLNGWTVTDFAGHGEPRVENGCIILPSGESLTGLNYTGKTPTTNYEVEMDAKRVQGSDFFCGLTVPVNDSYASLILGGWGGGVCGISSLDEQDAARNETTTYRKFDADQWYHIRLRIEPDRIKAWVDDENIVAVMLKGVKVSVRSEVEPSRPFGIASYQTTAAIRNIQIHLIAEEDRDK
jgi:hypothetical protein